MHKLILSDIPVNGQPINIVIDQKRRKIFERIIQQNSNMSKIMDVYNGVKPFEKGKGNPPQTDLTLKEKPFVKEGKKPGKGWMPLLRGSLIHRYVNKWDNDYWIQYGEWLAAPRDPSIFSAHTKIMIRQTGDSLIATVIGSNVVARNNLHILLPKNNNYSVNYVVGLINSHFLNFI